MTIEFVVARYIYFFRFSKSLTNVAVSGVCQDSDVETCSNGYHPNKEFCLGSLGAVYAAKRRRIRRNALKRATDCDAILNSVSY